MKRPLTILVLVAAALFGAISSASTYLAARRETELLNLRLFNITQDAETLAKLRVRNNVLAADLDDFYRMGGGPVGSEKGPDEDLIVSLRELERTQRLAPVSGHRSRQAAIAIEQAASAPTGTADARTGSPSERPDPISPPPNLNRKLTAKKAGSGSWDKK
jgi:hypothetical protein